MRRTVLVLALLLIVQSFILPAVVAADNCQNMGADERDRKCSIPEKVIGFFTGLGLMAAAAMRRQRQRNRWYEWALRQGKIGMKKPDLFGLLPGGTYQPKRDEDADPNEPEPPNPDAPPPDPDAPPDEAPPPPAPPKPPGVHGPPA